MSPTCARTCCRPASRATLVMTKDADHRIQRVLLRKP